MKLFCVQCLKPFESASPNRLYCTTDCAKAFRKEETRQTRETQASYRNCGRPISGGHVFDLGLQEERRR